MDQADGAVRQCDRDPGAHELLTPGPEFEIDGGAQIDPGITGMGAHGQCDVGVESLNPDRWDRIGRGRIGRVGPGHRGEF